VLALIPVRDATLPAGAAEAAAECAGNVLLVGSGTRAAASALPAARVTATDGHSTVRCLELGEFQPARWAAALASLLAHEPIVVVPAAPDGRDLAPRLAATLDRTLFAGAVQVSAERVVLARGGGLAMHTLTPPAAYIATLQIGVRGIDPADSTDAATIIELDAPGAGSGTGSAADVHLDARVVEVIGPDPATIDLAEASRIVGGGAGLTSAEQFDRLAALGGAIGASVGATRVITDRGWVPHERQIGTTGVVVDPQLYLAFGVSGAVQHTSGLGHPDHIISVNTDAHCPMMQLADLAVVADANEVLAHLVELLDANISTTGASADTASADGARR
jgi:electron transfer flavoprotein alpha subunit